MSKIIPIQVESTDVIIPDMDDKHLQMAETIKKVFGNQRTKPQKNLTPVPIHRATRINRVALVIAPMWGAQIAPYGIARLAGLSRHAGFETKCWDINAQCFSETKGQLHSHLWDWKWNSPELYKDEIHPVILPILEKFLNELVEFNPTVLGFTTYYTNIHCTTWLVSQIRERLPNTKILAGGPQVRMMPQYRGPVTKIFDYLISGEGELLFLQLLEGIENNNLPTETFLTHDKSIKIDLDSMPIPDYRDFDINLYQFKGVASEMSRGCIAKCTFCSETTFWRYRGRMSSNVLDEVEYNYKTFGIELVWFIDSLVNGNLNELLAFAQGLIDREIKVQWWGFARNDGRMTKDYLKTLLDSGCMGLAIGIESGSQKIVDLIAKKVKIAEVEQNFNDLAELGSFNTGTSWFVGFPGELPVDVAQTLTLVWRLRNAGLQNKGFGLCALGIDAPLTLQKKRFNIAERQFGGSWITEDWSNTVAHRVIRYKSVYILQNHYRLHKVRPELIGQRGEQLGFLTHYNLIYDVDNWIDDVKYDLEFNFNIIKTNISLFADSLVNEIWAILRVLWLAMGPFTLDVKFDPELDYPVYGEFRYFASGFGGLWANYKFNIDENGNWSADFYTKVETTHKEDQGCDFEHHWAGTGNWTRV
jgi:hypothetical protein